MMWIVPSYENSNICYGYFVTFKKKMTRILYLFCFSLSLISFGQTMENEYLKGKYDPKTDIISFTIDSLSISGSVNNTVERKTSLGDKDSFIVLNAKDKIVFVSFAFDFEEITINKINKLFILSKNDSLETVEQFVKGKYTESLIYQYDTDLGHTLKDSEGNSVKTEYWRKVESKKLNSTYAEKSGLKDYSGVYEVLILFYDNQKISTPYKGKLYVNESGISLISTLPSDGVIRGNHTNEKFIIDNMRDDKGLFSGKLSKGFGSDFALSINESKSAGGITLSGYSSSLTISFSITRKLVEIE